ncbi:hypothetical protein GS966_28985 [Rhodococcus hoagii]|nr:hypothetical protein [Prescottella equi]
MPGGFDLTATEAAWLREQMATAKPHPQFEHSLLSHLLRRSDAPDGAWSAPWMSTISPRPRPRYRISSITPEMFSLVIQGARLLYNLLLAERYEKLGLTSLDAPADYYRELLDEWAARCESRRDDVTVWQLSDLWPLVTMKAPRISPATTQFVESWVNAVQSQDCHTLATDPLCVGWCRIASSRTSARSRGCATTTACHMAGRVRDDTVVYRCSRRVASSPTSSRGWAVLTPDNRATFLEQLRPGRGDDSTTCGHHVHRRSRIRVDAAARLRRVWDSRDPLAMLAAVHSTSRTSTCSTSAVR